MLGGNTNGVNTYQGIDVATLTGGTLTNGDVLKPKNFACLLFQTVSRSHKTLASIMLTISKATTSYP